MSSKITLQTITTSIDDNNTIQKINENFSEIESTLDAFLSLDGTAPNQMQTELDLNGNNIINVATPTSAGMAANKSYVDAITTLALDSPAADITAADITNWDTAYSWGDHSGLYEPADATILKDADIGVTVAAYDPNPSLTAADIGVTVEGYDATILKDADIGVTVQAAGSYLTSETSHADVVVDGDFTSNGLLKRTSAGVYGIVTDASANWDTAYGWGNHALGGYLTSETSHADVVVDGDFASDGILKRTSAGVYGVITDSSADWNTAFGWGNHASAGYFVGTSVTAANIDAEASTDGFVLTSDGAGNAAWEAVAGGATPLTTKGDVYTYSTTDARLAVGTDGQVLTADSAEATGLKWATNTPSLPVTTKGDVLGYDTAAARVPVGTDGQVLTADSAESLGVKWATPAGGGGAMDDLTDADTSTVAPVVGDLLGWDGTNWVPSGPEYFSRFFEEFTFDHSTTPYAEWDEGTFGTSAAGLSAAVAGRPGVYQVQTGTATNGYAGIIRQQTYGSNYNSGWQMSDGDIIIKFGFRSTSLGDGTDLVKMRIGFLNQVTAAGLANGLNFLVDTSTWGDTRFGGGSIVSSSEYTNSLNVLSMVVDTWYKGMIVVNAAGTQADFYVDGTKVATITDIPSGTISPAVQISKHGGTTNNNMQIDYFEVIQYFSGGR